MTTAVALAVHIFGAVIWVGGMFAIYVSLRPALGTLDPPQRLRLMTIVPISWCSRAEGLHRPQSLDLVPPSGREGVAFGVLTFVPHAPLAESELMLRVHERRRGAGSRPVDAARSQHAIAYNLLVLARAHRAPDFSCQLLADHSPLPHAASPHCERHDQKER